MDKYLAMYDYRLKDVAISNWILTYHMQDGG